MSLIMSLTKLKGVVHPEINIYLQVFLKLNEFFILLNTKEDILKDVNNH